LLSDVFLPLTTLVEEGPQVAIFRLSKARSKIAACGSSYRGMCVKNIEHLPNIQHKNHVSFAPRLTTNPRGQFV